MLLFLLGSVWVCEFRKIFATTRASQAEFRDVFPKRSQFPLGRLKMRFYLLFSDLYFTLTQRCPECFESDRILAAGIAGGHQRKSWCQLLKLQTLIFSGGNSMGELITKPQWFSLVVWEPLNKLGSRSSLRTKLSVRRGRRGIKFVVGVWVFKPQMTSTHE